MYRKYILWYLLAKAGAKALTMVSLLLTDRLSLPFAVNLSALLFVLLGAGLLVKAVQRKEKGRHLALLLLADSALVLFNIFYISRGTPLAVSPVEMVITGTAVDFLVGGACLFLLARQSRYVQISQANQES